MVLHVLKFTEMQLYYECHFAKHLHSLLTFEILPTRCVNMLAKGDLVYLF